MGTGMVATHVGVGVSVSVGVGAAGAGTLGAGRKSVAAGVATGGAKTTVAAGGWAGAPRLVQRISATGSKPIPAKTNNRWRANSG